MPMALSRGCPSENRTYGRFRREVRWRTHDGGQRKYTDHNGYHRRVQIEKDTFSHKFRAHAKLGETPLSVTNATTELKTGEAQSGL